MAKIAGVQEVDVSILRPYERNAKKHSDDQVAKLVESIREFGFISPCLIDKEMNVIAGHGRIMAAKKAGMKTVPCVFVEGLTEEQRRAYILADNRLTELGDWNQELVVGELKQLKQMDFDIALTGFDFAENWFEDRKRNDKSRQEGNSEYNEFLDKFEEKKTTDDCYTPDNVYEAVANWVAREWNLDRKDFVRPFYPGGDYKKEKYKKGAVVVDNPPFSILSEIIRWYCDNGIKFFLFGPTMSLFTAVGADVEYMPVGVAILYENGATVNTSFINNIGDSRIYLAPELYQAVDAANDDNLRAMHKDLPKYDYPMEAVLAGRVYNLAKYGQTLKIPKSECVYRNRLDAQKELGKDAFGGLYLISERAAAERAAAERAAAERAAAERAAAERAAATRWELSDKEREIIRGLGKAEV